MIKEENIRGRFFSIEKIRLTDYTTTIHHIPKKLLQFTEHKTWATFCLL